MISCGKNDTLRGDLRPLYSPLQRPNMGHTSCPNVLQYLNQGKLDSQIATNTSPNFLKFMLLKIQILSAFKRGAKSHSHICKSQNARYQKSMKLSIILPAENFSAKILFFKKFFNFKPNLPKIQKKKHFEMKFL